MNGNGIERVLATAEQPRPVSPEFVDRIAGAMFAELAAETAPAVAAPPVTKRPIVGRAVAGRPAAVLRPRVFLRRPAFAMAAAAMAAVLVASVVVLSPDTPSALAALEEARTQFRTLPSYHARTAVSANENNDDPDFETQWETEDHYRDRETWRTTITSTNAAAGSPGDYRVLAGGLYGDYRAAAGIITVTPAAETENAEGANPALFFDPSLQWWDTGTPGQPGRPSDEFFAESCSAGDTVFLGRAATRLRCPAQPRDIELLLDQQTGMLLRLAAFDIVREIRSIEFTADFAPGVFDLQPPDGTRKRWGGNGAAPPEYQAALGTEVAARYRLVGGASAGASVAAVTPTDVWVLTISCGQGRCDHQLRQLDSRSGRVVAVIDPPQGEFIDDVEVVGTDVWVSMTERSADGNTMTGGVVQRLEAGTGRLVGPRLRTGPQGGALVAFGGELWSTGGTARPVTVGPAQGEYRSLARIDVASGRVTQVQLDGGANSAPVVAGGKVWVGTERFDERNPYRMLYRVVAVDPASNSVVRTVTAPGYAGAPTFVGDRIYTVFQVEEAGREQWVIGVAGPTDAAFSTTRRIAAAGSELGRLVFAAGRLWITSFLQDSLLRIDPESLEVTAEIPTGRGPSDAGAGRDAIWVVNSQDGTLVRIDVD